MALNTFPCIELKISSFSSTFLQLFFPLLMQLNLDGLFSHELLLFLAINKIVMHQSSLQKISRLSQCFMYLIQVIQQQNL
jgi:hypothetical protein